MCNVIAIYCSPTISNLLKTSLIVGLSVGGASNFINAKEYLDVISFPIKTPLQGSIKT